jgi:hypothetical protein
MTIYRLLKDAKGLETADDLGRDRVAVADFAYQNDALAQLIVDAWVDKTFRENIMKKGNAKPELAKRGIYLQNPVIIDEKTYWSKEGYTQADDDEVVFVLPDPERVGRDAPPHSLLETARFLMACVPNGI